VHLQGIQFVHSEVGMSVVDVDSVQATVTRQRMMEMGQPTTCVSPGCIWNSPASAHYGFVPEPWRSLV
jgi:hypothetical protein